MIKENSLENISESDKKIYSYKEIIKICNDVEGMEIRTTQKTSLAWLIEELSKENPVQWQQKARELNKLFSTELWTPRKIDMVLWTCGR